MRIVHLVHQYLPEYVGGTELYTQSLARELTARGHDVTVFYRRSAEGRGCTIREEAGARVWAAWDGVVSANSRFLATFRGGALPGVFAQMLNETRPDLVHIQHLMGLPVSLAQMLRARRIPYLVTLHDYWWVCANAQLLTNYDATVCAGPRGYVNCARCALARGGVAKMLPTIPPLMGILAWRNALLRRVLRDAAAMIAPSAFVQQWYTAHGRLAACGLVISHGIASPPEVSIIPHDGPRRLAYIGGLSWQKGVHVVVEAFQHIEGAELWIAGDETADPAYARHLRTLASPHVRFLGKLDRAGVWETLAQVDGVVVPSLWYETFSLIVREAFAAGVPVIVSDLGALREAVRDGVDGLCVPPGDVAAWRAALQRVLASPVLRAALRANIQRPLTLSSHVDRVESVYRNLMNKEGVPQ